MDMEEGQERTGRGRNEDREKRISHNDNENVTRASHFLIMRTTTMSPPLQTTQWMQRATEGKRERERET